VGPVAAGVGSGVDESAVGGDEDGGADEVAGDDVVDEVGVCGEGVDAGSAPVVHPDSRMSASAASGTLLTKSTLLGDR
jgi:hypothetical protein